jgi:hypothetical protein
VQILATLLSILYYKFKNEETVDGHMVTGPEQQSKVHYPVP